jgi:hypothetical protein
VRDSDRFVGRSAVVIGKGVVRDLICTRAGHVIWGAVPDGGDVLSGLDWHSSLRGRGWSWHRNY